MAEWSIATVLKTAEGHTSGGSNPSLSATFKKNSLKFSEFFSFITPSQFYPYNVDYG